MSYLNNATEHNVLNEIRAQVEALNATLRRARLLGMDVSALYVPADGVAIVRVVGDVNREAHIRIEIGGRR